jgi:hypothetical protein
LGKAAKEEILELLIPPLPSVCFEEKRNRRKQCWMMLRDGIKEAHAGEVREELRWRGEALKNLQCLKISERGSIALSQMLSCHTLQHSRKTMH